MKDFKPFFFEGNLRWGNMNTPEDVAQLLIDYSYEELRHAQRLGKSENAKTPCFGFYHEYNDKYTLGEWIDENEQESYFTSEIPLI
jgi:hypothetical protein